MTGPIVVGFDGSPGARAALGVAIDLARALSEELILVFGTAPPGVMGEEAREHREAIEQIAADATAPAVEEARAAGANVRTELRPEKPVEALLTVAEDVGARMIVCGSYGERPLRGVILGSTPHKLLHSADRPVLVVPQPSAGGA
jgi:nucleotide-binding universal stress UspA family protein